MKKTEIIDGHKAGDGYTWAQFRHIDEVLPLFINENVDTSDYARIHFYNMVEDYSKYAPSLLHLQIIKNKNLEVTKNNALLDLVVPVLPVGYMTNNENDYEKLILSGTPENIKQENEALSPEEHKKRIKEHSDEALNYFLFSVAERYYVAMQNNDKKTMNMLAGLKVFDEINFDLDSFVKLKNGESVDLGFTMAYKSYLNTQEKYNKLKRVLKSYREYEVRQELEEKNTLHSNKPRSLGRTPKEPGNE